jgi:osmotically-inducible protein OsmY
MPIERSRQRFDLIVPRSPRGERDREVDLREMASQCDISVLERRLLLGGRERPVGASPREGTAMTKAILLLGALALVACQKENKANDRTGSTTVTGASTTGRGETQTTQAMRDQMRRDNPTSLSVIQDIILADDGSTLIVSGTVPDEQTHDQLMKSAQNTPGVKRVQDDLKVRGK